MSDIPNSMSRRRLGLGLALLMTPLAARAGPSAAAKVLFVCQAGTVKSAIAREALKQRAAQRGLALEGRSRGINIEDHVSPGLAARLAVDGLNPRAEAATALGAGDLAWPDLVIAFDEAAHATGLERARVWTIASWNDRYDEAKAGMEANISALLVELAARGCPP
jgi:protein-tyrosine-phosphatase